MSSSSSVGVRSRLLRRLRKPRRALRTLRRLLLPSLLLASAALFERGALADARDWVIVEVSREAARHVDKELAERLIALETGDVDVPAPPHEKQKPPLYFRILAPTTSDLRVELWELGKPYGFRRVSSAGTENLRARRIALAAGELARRLRSRRIVELEAARRADEEARAERRADPGFPIYGRFVLDASVRGADVGLGDAWFVGPALDAQLAFSSGQRLALGASWLAGDASDGGSRARWLEARVSFVQRFVLSAVTGVGVGVEVALASLRIDGFSSRSGTSPLDAATSRAGVFARLEPRLARYFALGFGPDIGVIVHPVDARSEDGEARRIGGLWLGASLGIEIDPAAPR